MKISEKIKHPFRRQPPTEEELAARVEAETMREQARQEAADASFRQQAQGPF